MFNELKQQYSNCNRCEKLCRSRTQVVFGSGNPDAEILFIGEAPGANEDKQGIPFCGMSGQVLNQLLASANLSREDIFITNTILCRPENNRNPTKEEVANCKDRLDRLIRIMDPKVIVTIGNFATERILGKTGIKSLRGKVFSYIDKEADKGVHKGVHKEVSDEVPKKVIPVIHPASYLYSGRNPEMFEQMKKDFQTISEMIKENDKQKDNKQKRLMEYSVF